MYVKTLTVKGFKSFASATTLRLEPGITCVVGPNGSGKSNVVDAVAWAMGEQGAKSLRGGKMEDVIFAGTAGRPPLGRAEVSLTIDNTDGALPIDYAEVTVSRTMFRTGGSDYAINGTPCRLLDVQELLADSGIGREMHVIVGQGQLDAVLRASPEERRGFIEEAAGVLKHRRRKERAVRKLDAMEANLTRVRDLTGEIRRQLGPLGRQAETARRAALIQATVRDARSRLLADDLVQLTATLEQEIADETALELRRQEIAAALRDAQAELAAHEHHLGLARPRLARAQETWFALSRLVERLSGTATVASERVRLLREEEPGPSAATTVSRDPDELRRQAEALRAEQRGVLDRLVELRADLAGAEQARGAAEDACSAEQQRVRSAERAAADRREGLATLAGRVAAKASRVEAAENQIARLRGIVDQCHDRARAAEDRYADLEASIAVDEDGEQGLDAAYEAAERDVERLEAEVSAATAAEREADGLRQSGQARVEALRLSLDRSQDGTALLATADTAGYAGSVASVVQVESGRELAVAAALGWAANAGVARDGDAAVAALGTVRDAEAGRVSLLVPDSAGELAHGDWPVLPPGIRWARDAVTCPEWIRPAVDRVLHLVALVGDLDEARTVAAQLPGVAAVTPEGDIVAPGAVHGGGTAAPSQLELQAAIAATESDVAAAAATAEQARFARARAQRERDEAAERAQQFLEQLHESDARMSAVAEELGAVGATIRGAREEIERTRRAIAAAQADADGDRAEHAELVERLAAAQAQPDPTGGQVPDDRERLDALAADARLQETDVRLRLRTAEERARAIGERADALAAAAEAEVAERRRHEARARRRRADAAVAGAVCTAATYAADLLSASAARADTQRREAEAERDLRERHLAMARRQVAELSEQAREATDSAHRDEMARAEQRLRLEQVETRIWEELHLDPAVLVEEFGPHRSVPHLVGPDDDPEHLPEPVAYLRSEQEKRLRSAERRLAALGRVNPLALEEYAALEERHTFLTTQLDDLVRSKRDLLDIVREVDERVERVFAEAYRDTAAHFEHVFARLFPGGEGRLILTDPENLLTTGLDVEARPPGKKIKRLSLLSGGERSLVAVALLVSIFKARPSPFYVLDEVEAALDDANLERLLVLLQELRDSSQLIVITHQKKTMQIADALYGVTMRGDGVSTVISQRLRDATEAVSA